MKQCRARHILVGTQAEALDVKNQLEAGVDFAGLAVRLSKCPSGKKSGGDLGQFRQGQMVPQFDQVCFSAPLNEVHGPVQTRFGWHVIEILARSE